jgi:hypothetical protein
LQQPYVSLPQGAAALAAVLLATCPAALCAATAFTVDDSASRIESQSPVRWSADRSALHGRSAVDSHLRVQARLDLRPWVGQRGRIYLVLPAQPLASLRVQWRTQGRLRPGILAGGQRALVFEGPVTEPLLQDRLDVVVQADSRELVMPQRLHLAFEIELIE